MNYITYGNVPNNKSTLIELILILFIVLFPYWPLKLKLGGLYFLISFIIFSIVFFILCISIAIIGILFGYNIFIMPNIDDTNLSWKDRLFNPFIAINEREDTHSCKIIRNIIIISLAIMAIIIAYLYPKILKESYDMFKNLIISLLKYARKKIEDFHYNRSL